jgi:predicted metal-binding protein
MDESYLELEAIILANKSQSGQDVLTSIKSVVNHGLGCMQWERRPLKLGQNIAH